MKNNDSIYDQIIEKIIFNRISTTEVADCLNKTGVLENVKPINRGHFKVGRVFFAYAYNESNWEIHEQLQNVKENDIVIVETHNCKNRAIFGDLVSKYILLYKRAAAVIINGNMRDANRIIRENRPIWAKDLTPIGCFNMKNDSELDATIVNTWKKKYDGTIAVCDDGGVVIIPKERINEQFLEKLDFIELQEDIWYYCIDTKKWSTFDTVCLKKYSKTELLPEELRDKLAKFLKKD